MSENGQRWIRKIYQILKALSEASHADRSRPIFVLGSYFEGRDKKAKEQPMSHIEMTHGLQKNYQFSILVYLLR